VHCPKLDCIVTSGGAILDLSNGRLLSRFAIPRNRLSRQQQKLGTANDLNRDFFRQSPSRRRPIPVNSVSTLAIVSAQPLLNLTVYDPRNVGFTCGPYEAEALSLFRIASTGTAFRSLHSPTRVKHRGLGCILGPGLRIVPTLQATNLPSSRQGACSYSAAVWLWGLGIYLTTCCKDEDSLKSRS
jgi:hypothetical protein